VYAAHPDARIEYETKRLKDLRREQELETKKNTRNCIDLRLSYDGGASSLDIFLHAFTDNETQT
jgi:hypothetical protein